MKVTDPRAMNETFARAFNSRNIENLLALYESDAVLKVDSSNTSLIGTRQIGTELGAFMQIPGTMVSKNNFCIERDGLALLRADWALVGEDGTTVVSGSSAEILRRQPDGSWLYAIDHAAGAGLPRVV